MTLPTQRTWRSLTRVGCPAGLLLVKWWLLAIPHYIIVGLFTGGGLWVAWRADQHSSNWPGLIGCPAIIAAVVLEVTGRYPRQIFDLVLGLNRWVLRVAAYAALMTDQYPPFRLDLGGHDPGGVHTLPQLDDAPPIHDSPPVPASQPALTSPPPSRRPGWTAGRIACLVAGAVLALCSLGVLGASATATAWWADGARHGGYLDLGTDTYASSGYAVESTPIQLPGPASGWDLVDLGGSPSVAVAERDALGTTARIAIWPPHRLRPALGAVDAELARLDQAASRFRANSEICRVQARAGHGAQVVSESLAEVVQVALTAAAWTGGLVDPTIGAALVALGYDRDFELIAASQSDIPAGRAEVPGWQSVWIEGRLLKIRPGTKLDFGATAKGLGSDWMARAVMGRRAAVASLSAWAATSRRPVRPRAVDGLC
jgi:hypothetical protein